MITETETNKPLIYNEYSLQKWLALRKFKPSEHGTFNIKGDSYGRYLCIVERQYNPDNDVLSNSKNRFSNQVIRNIELCYWNSSANMFQDSNRDWVNVIFWCPVPELPSHTFETISREDILKKIETGELELISHEKEREGDKDIPGLWNITKSHSSVYNSSFTDTIFISTETISGLEDCIFAKKKSLFPLKFITDNNDIQVENLRFGQLVYHEELYWGRERMKIVGIRETEVELEGDYSGGTNNVCQKSWMPIKGLYLHKQERNKL